jgi:hypothetical protein
MRTSSLELILSHLQTIHIHAISRLVSLVQQGVTGRDLGLDGGWGSHLLDYCSICTVAGRRVFDSCLY